MFISVHFVDDCVKIIYLKNKLSLQSLWIPSYRSHFGSRYQLVACYAQSIFDFIDLVDPEDVVREQSLHQCSLAAIPRRIHRISSELRS